MKHMGSNKMIGHKMRTAHNAIDKYFDRQMKSGDHKKICLPKGQGMMMHYIMENYQDHDVYQKEVEEVFSITGATASNILKGLEKAGLIVRIPSEKDARLKRITPTQEAIEREERIKESFFNFEKGLRNGMTEEEVTTFCELLDRLILNLGEMNSQDS